MTTHPDERPNHPDQLDHARWVYRLGSAIDWLAGGWRRRRAQPVRCTCPGFTSVGVSPECPVHGHEVRGPNL